MEVTDRTDVLSVINLITNLGFWRSAVPQALVASKDSASRLVAESLTASDEVADLQFRPGPRPPIPGVMVLRRSFGGINLR